jgi:uncharacterized protein YbaP (TraB family)
MNRHRHLAAIMATITTVAMAACAPAFATAPSTADGSTRIPLWKVTSAQRTMYLTGAMGVPLKTRPVPKRTAQVFGQSGTLVMEADVGPKAQAGAKALLKQYAPLPDHKTLADDLTATQLGHVKMLVGALGVDYDSVQHDQPWVVAMDLLHAAEKKSGRKPHPRMRHFKQLAAQRHMALVPLDTPKQELDMLAGMPAKLQIGFLMMPVHQVLHPRSAVQNKQATREAWAAGDMPMAAKSFDAHFKDFPGLYQAIVTSRHDRWTRTLKDMLDKSGKPVFVVVGAPHLFGPRNLLDHLRKAGFTVTQM